jgi:putative phage-type endonuclease
MQQVVLAQGTQEWHLHRAKYFNASEAPAMTGDSNYITRSELLKQKFEGVTPDVDKWQQQRYDDGHLFEAQARALAEAVIGEELFPVVGVEGKYSASFDGITMLEDVIWEHKTLNKLLEAVTCIEELPEPYKVQMEHQLMVSGAEKCLFTATKFDDEGNLLGKLELWYFPDMERRKKIVAWWEQFAIDLANYVPVEITERVKADPIKDLPTVVVQVKGELTLSNFDEVTPLFDRFFSEAVTEFKTDEDFALAEQQAKAGRSAAKECRNVADSVINQMASVSDVIRSLQNYADRFDKLALSQEKAVKSQKEAIKAEIVAKARTEFMVHIEALNSEFNGLTMMPTIQADWDGAVKNKRTISSLHDSVSVELARVKILANETATTIRKNIAHFNEVANKFTFLFSDRSTLLHKQFDDLAASIELRITQHKQAEQARLEAERERIRQEEAEKAQRQAAELARQAEAQVTAKVETEKAIAQAVVATSKPETMAEQHPTVAAQTFAPVRRDLLIPFELVETVADLARDAYKTKKGEPKFDALVALIKRNKEQQ